MKGYIYSISNEDKSIVYIGSTSLTIKERWRSHKKDYNAWLRNKRSSCAIYHYFKQHGIENFSISLISEHDVESKDQLREFEQLVIDRTENICNERNSFRTREEYLRQRRAEYQRLKETANARRAERIQCGCGMEHRRGDKARHERSQKHQNWLLNQ